MAEICREVAVNNGKNPVISSSCETSSTQVARRRRMEIRRFKFVAGVSTPDDSEIIDGTKRRRIEITRTTSCSSECIENCVSAVRVRDMITSSSNSDEDQNKVETTTSFHQSRTKSLGLSSSDLIIDNNNENSINGVPKFGVASVCGRRRDMEDAVAVHTSFFRSDNNSDLHYFGVYDGHGCSHVAMKCRDRFHELVKEEIMEELEWKSAMERSFSKMDKEVIVSNEGVVGNCRCELQTPECDAVGSTAVVAVVSPEKIVVANCGDSRAVLCRNGKAFPLSSDHKPDRPDELNRIQEAGGRVIFWDGPRVLGVLAMSRAIGDNYLKPYVSCEPEVTITDRTADDDCLILASDGLWDVVSNDTACGVARMCLKGKVPPTTLTAEVEEIIGAGEGNTDKACSDAAMLLTKLALARHSTDNVSVVVINLRKDT